ncbi:hypothetical protein P700755_002112 [Psychroflexus torquis ATCC 700755]|uniref:VWFA domain-containing protein n=1 Tax=Psychroflexus torquis (strain ATCC 700755 / CIP 106069 / ACAM 623) TaxID=313595 RepID=K4IGH9_PSYTT|nr:hypothetical protein [Psychroflexus torquis]AFU68903.1 hypothetical protein P700755_002112 [Psychroflexus torquis ATCC 700755]
MKIFLISLLVSLNIFSCDPDNKSSKSQDKKSIVCLLDISSSTKENNLNLFLDNIVKEAISKMDESTSIVVLAIDNGSQTAAAPLFDMDLSEISFINPSLPMTVRDKMAQRKKKEFIEELKAGFKQKVMAKINERKEYATHTDIFGSLGQIERYKATTTTVMIFSDMLNYSEVFNMESLVEKSANLIDEIKNAPSITAKGKISVYVSTGANVKLGPKKFNSVKEFWTAYFANNGYELSDYTSGELSI